MIIKLLEYLVWICLTLSTLFMVADFIGIMPKKFRKMLRLNKSDDTLEVLKELGINIESYRRSVSQVSFPKNYDNQSVEEQVKKELNKIKINKSIAVGHNRTTKLDYYIDLIGKSCDKSVACSFAQYLSTYWATNVKDNSVIKQPIIDFVVTPKGGSPILGYEFANLVKRPFVLHEKSERFQDNKDDFRAYFNCKEIPEEHSTALIVDDSTTGGNMVINTIDNLRRFGYKVEDCLVVFEPKSKDARKKLRDKEVNLISIVSTHEE